MKAIVKERNLIGNYVLKVMADGGQLLTVLSENYSPKADCGVHDLSLEDDSDIPVKKKVLYSEVGNTGKKAKLTNVHRLIMICAVPQIKETYDNVKLLFKLTNLNKIPFRFVSDFKLLLIVHDIQTSTAMNPCPYCFVTIRDL